MSLLDMLKQYAGGSASTSEADVHQHFDQVAQSVPQSDMAERTRARVSFRPDACVRADGLQHVQSIQWRAKSRNVKSLAYMRRARGLGADSWRQHAVRDALRRQQPGHARAGTEHFSRSRPATGFARRTDGSFHHRKGQLVLCAAPDSDQDVGSRGDVDRHGETGEARRRIAFSIAAVELGKKRLRLIFRFVTS